MIMVVIIVGVVVFHLTMIEKGVCRCSTLPIRNDRFFISDCHNRERRHDHMCRHIRGSHRKGSQRGLG